MCKIHSFIADIYIAPLQVGMSGRKCPRGNVARLQRRQSGLKSGGVVDPGPKISIL